MGKDTHLEVEAARRGSSSLLGGFPVHRGSADREALRPAPTSSSGGEPLVMFPEGTRQTGPVVEELFDGAAYVASPHRRADRPGRHRRERGDVPKGAKLLHPVEAGAASSATRIPAPPLTESGPGAPRGGAGAHRAAPRRPPGALRRGPGAGRSSPTRRGERADPPRRHRPGRHPARAGLRRDPSHPRRHRRHGRRPASRWWWRPAGASGPPSRCCSSGDRARPRRVLERGVEVLARGATIARRARRSPTRSSTTSS